MNAKLNRDLIFILMLFLVLLSACKKESEKVVPTVVIDGINSITSSTVTCVGEIISDGGEIPVRGICWNTNPEPTISDNTITNGAGTGKFTSTITGLSPGTIYYIRAYGTNSIGTGYSSQGTFKTVAALPTLVTIDLSNLNFTSAVSGGNITNDGGAQISDRGVCWSKSPNPTTADNKTNDGTGTGAFNSMISGLASNTTYYLRAYATNIQGTAYGNQIVFTTKSSSGNNTVTDIDGNVYSTVTIGNQVWMTENLRTRRYRNGDPIPLVNDNTAWISLTTGAFCITYGRNLYNWYAVTDSRNIAPIGWHVPTMYEWDILANYLAGYGLAGGKLKEAGFTHWDTPNTGATNETGFTALPSGARSEEGLFHNVGINGYWWSSSTGWNVQLKYNSDDLFKYTSRLVCGYSVRCVKD